MDDFLQKLKKVVRTVLYGPAISQSDCRKPGPYQLPSNKIKYVIQHVFLIYNSERLFNLEKSNVNGIKEAR